MPGGFGQRGAEGKIKAATFARERKVPYFGICFGMQMAVIEAARSLAGVSEANSTEFGPTSEPVVGLMTEWMKGNELEMRRQGGDLGGTMRLGSYAAMLKPGSKIADIYGSNAITERHRHRYEVNMAYRERLEAKGMVFCGTSPDGLLPETIEYADHPWFIGVQYHPELKSRPFEPHPLFRSFIDRGGGAEPARVTVARQILAASTISSSRSPISMRRPRIYEAMGFTVGPPQPPSLGHARTGSSSSPGASSS